jgi:hypothetical protein
MPWEQELENDLKWREVELAALKFAVTQSAPNTVPHKALLRAAWAMLYAHYEGFCLFALSLFLDEVKKSGATRDRCKAPLMLFSLEETFRKIRKRTPPAPDFHTFCSTTFPTLMSAAIDFEINGDGDFVLAGRSNLYGKHLLQHCETMCLVESCIDANKTKLGLLVTRRNKIAHGEQELVSNLTEYKQYEDAAIEVMHDLAVAIVDALDNKTYLKPAYHAP